MFLSIDNVAFSIFGFDVYWYGLIIGIGILTAVYIALREAVKLGMTEDDILNGVLFIVPASIIGARIYFCIFFYGIDVLFNPSLLFAIHDGGLAIHGGIIVGFVGAYIYCKKVGLNIIQIFDLMAPSFLIAQSFGRWGNFINQEAHGGKTSREFLSETLSLPDFIVDNMQIGSSYYHPTFLYESVWNLIGFSIIMFTRRLKIFKSGEYFYFYLSWYGLGRMLIEFARTDALVIGDTGIRTNVLSSMLMFIAGVTLVVYNRIKHSDNEYYVDNLS